MTTKGLNMSPKNYDVISNAESTNIKQEMEHSATKIRFLYLSFDF